jgi:methylmalonyl-CoA mutase C-terminal domain/subunit
MTSNKKIHMLLAKAGLDGHDVGAKVVARALMEAGFDVTYTGLRRSPEEIARQARQLEVDVIGFSVLSGSHVPLCRQFNELRKTYHLEDCLWVVGGVIPEEDVEVLRELGVDGVFPVGTPLEAITEFIREKRS